MKLLFDQNISFRIIKLISFDFPDSIHVKKVGLENSTDFEIWEFANINGYHIVTFDSDFFDLLQIKGFPPKIIWLRTGNTTTTNIAELLSSRQSLIKEFISSEEFKELGCLEIDDVSRKT